MHTPLSEAANWYRLAIEHANDAWLLTDGAVILDCNPRAHQALGLDRAALVGRTLREVAPGARALIREIKVRRNDGTGTEWPVNLIGAEGTPIRAHVAVSALGPTGAPPYALRVREMAAADTPEATASSMDQSYLRALFEHAPEAIVVLDRADRILAANPRFLTLFGYAQTEALGAAIDTLIVPESLRTEAAGLNRTALTGMDAEHQTLRRRKDGSVLPVSILAAPIVHDGQVVAFYSIYRDLSPLQDIAARLEQTQARLDVVVSQAPIALFILDEQAMFTFCAGKALETAGVASTDLLGHCAYDRFKAYPDILAAVGQALRGERATTLTPFRDLTYEIQYSPVLDASGRSVGVFGLVRDVTETQLARQQLEFMAHHDLLTHLPNRSLFNDRLQEALLRAKRRGTHVALLFFDLDGFKQVNDTLGHQTGDRLLQWVAQRARSAVRDMDTVARLGGDEFAVLVEDIDTPIGAAAVAQRLLESLGQPYVDGEQPIPTSASIGISLYPTDGLDPDSLLKAADLAMYRAKAAGRNRYEFFASDLGATAATIFAKTAWMRQALEHNGFVLHYQPILRLHDGGVTGVEALIRLRQPDGALMPPLEFIALAEETGLIVPIGRWVAHEACRQWKAWHAAGIHDLRMAINLSAREFHDVTCVRAIGEALKAHGMPGDQFMVEITESMMFPDPARARTLLEELRDMHIAVAIDDFGTGYSSLSHLRDVPADFIKIDQSFVAGIPADEKTCGIVRTIMAMARGLGLQVIAEGVETEAQQRYLRELECDEVQGFLLGRPLPATELAQWLAQRQDRR